LNLFKNTNFEAKLSRNHCDDTFFDGKRILMKDLDKLGRKISKVLFIEDSKEVVYSKHLRNVVYVSSWRGNNDKDEELLNLKNILCKMKDDEEVYSFVDSLK
jgi:TFIIF-interacting CTD phosphatase-like protein